MSVIDDYLAGILPDQRAALERVRAIVREAVPAADEAISYGMPAFKFQGKYVIGFCAFKNHLSLFPTPEPIEALKDKLSDYVLAKGTIQFTLDHPLSESLIREIIAYRLKQIEVSK